MDYLLDTDTVIDVLKNRGVGIERFKNIKDGKFFLSIISWMEVEYGIKKPGNNIKKQLIFDDFLSAFNISVLLLNEEVGNSYLEIKLDLEERKTPISDFDLIIAGTAHNHNLTLVTGNIKHFGRIKNLKIL